MGWTVYYLMQVVLINKGFKLLFKFTGRMIIKPVNASVIKISKYEYGIIAV